MMYTGMPAVTAAAVVNTDESPRGSLPPSSSQPRALVPLGSDAHAAWAQTTVSRLTAVPALSVDTRRRTPARGTYRNATW